MQIKAKSLLLIIPLILTTILMTTGIAFAEVDPEGVEIPQRGLPEYGEEAAKGIVESILDWFFIIAGVLCIVIIIWAGITYATAGGDEEKVAKAKARLIYGIIGVAVIIAAYAITQFIKEAIEGGEIPAPEL